MGKYGISINLNHFEETSHLRRRHLVHENKFSGSRSPMYDSAGYYDPNTLIENGFSETVNETLNTFRPPSPTFDDYN